MCLGFLDEKIRKNVKYGYKVFEICNNKIYNEYYSLEGYYYCGCTKYELNNWYRSTDGIIKNYDAVGYESGFHVFTNKKDAKVWLGADNRNCKIFKVEVRNIVASGKQFIKLLNFVDEVILDVVVAKEMKILEEVEC
jgi:hypothetical protein